MAATSTMVGDAFLSAPIQTMIDKLTSADFQDYTNNQKLNISLLTQLHTTLLALGSVLDYAEMKQFDNRDIQKWLYELKDAIYDTEDLLNQISYDSMRCKFTSQVLNFLSSLFNTNRDVNSQIKISCERLQLFAQQIEILGLQMVSRKVLTRPPTSSLVNEYVTVGRKDDKEELVKMLLSDTDNNNMDVVAISGMGGLGKTTLAQLLYNEEEVNNHFDVKAWTCVSEDFDIL